MKKQILIALTALFAFNFLFSACTNTAEKAKLQEPVLPADTTSVTPRDTTVDSKATKNEKEGLDDDEDDKK